MNWKSRSLLLALMLAMPDYAAGQALAAPKTASPQPKAHAAPAGASKIKGSSSAAVKAEPSAVSSPKTESAAASAAGRTDAEVAQSGGENLDPVLPSEQFFGAAAMGYAAAGHCPHVCSKLFCYCGCDITDGHKSLLDCFTTMHGADCHICQEESLMALRMFREDETLAAIQKAVDETYSPKYPFKDESPALKRYKSLRKWQPLIGGQPPDKPAGDVCCGPK